ncbi:MAG: hypothetical protein ACFE9L_16240 [Candidatus Hodarchaeota archaeon]
MNNLDVKNIDFDTHTTSEHEFYARPDPYLRPFAVQAHEMTQEDETIDKIAFNIDQHDEIIRISIRGLLATTEPLPIMLSFSLPIMAPLISRTHYLRSMRELPTTETFPIIASLAEHYDTPPNIFKVDIHQIPIGYSLERESFPDIIKSSLDEDFIVSSEDLDQFHNNLNDPDPERVRVREKTLARAMKIFEKYKDNV